MSPRLFPRDRLVRTSSPKEVGRWSRPSPEPGSTLMSGQGNKTEDPPGHRPLQALMRTNRKATLESDEQGIKDDAYCRRVDGPWCRFFARWITRPGHGAAGGVAGRADARRTRPGARVGGSPDGAALGADRIACGR